MSAANTNVTDVDDSRDCAHLLTRVLARIADKWTVMVVAALATGPMRFAALARSIEGISQRMLTLTLRNLEADGLVARTVYPTAPPQVEYRLTEMGFTLTDPLRSLLDWAKANLEHMESARHVRAKQREGETRP